MPAPVLLLGASVMGAHPLPQAFPPRLQALPPPPTCCLPPASAWPFLGSFVTAWRWGGQWGGGADPAVRAERKFRDFSIGREGPRVLGRDRGFQGRLKYAPSLCHEGPVPLRGQECAGRMMSWLCLQSHGRGAAATSGPAPADTAPFHLSLFTDGLILAVSATSLSPARCGCYLTANTDLPAGGAPCGLGNCAYLTLPGKRRRESTYLGSGGPPGGLSYPLLIGWLLSSLTSCPDTLLVQQGPVA